MLIKQLVNKLELVLFFILIEIKHIILINGEIEPGLF